MPTLPQGEVDAETERELVADYPDPDMGAFPMHHVVPRLSESPGEIRWAGGELGQDRGQQVAEVVVADGEAAEPGVVGREGGAARDGA